jgi:cyclopropane fatty-acyl-phospholipid synthase-like methyltransferase
MPILSKYAQKKKIDFFLRDINKSSSILEIGSGSQWLGEFMKKNSWVNYAGIDLKAPADIVGDIRSWRQLNLKPKSFDYIIAFEVVEHIDIFQECYELLKDDGVLFLTTPLPHMDWILKLLEKIGLNQKRTSPHVNLIYLNKIKLFTPMELRKTAFLSQWGKFKKSNADLKHAI